MFTPAHLAILFNIFCTCYSQGRQDYFKYHGPNLTTSEESGFSKYVFLDNNIVSTINDTTLQGDEIYFPKCCPRGYFYEDTERKCNQSNDTSIYEELSLDVNLIKIGLAECDVIVDHVLPKDGFRSKIHKEDASVSIEGSIFKLGRYCIDNIVNTEKHIVRVCYDKEYCNSDVRLRCLKKCCPDGEMYIGRSCGKNPEYGVQLADFEKVIGELTDQYAVYHQNRACILYRANVSAYELIIDNRGSLYVHPDEGWQNYTVQDEIYCFEVFDDNGIITPLMLLCSRDSRNDLRFVLSKICMILSCLCLLLTMVIYCVVYKLEKVRHRVVFCYCLAHIIGFGTLTYVQFEPRQDTHCKGLAFAVQFGFLAAFAWLNTMCYDIWKTIVSMKNKGSSSDTKRTIYYNLYAWLVPAIITLLCYAEHTFNIFPDVLHAYVGESFCILENRMQAGNYGHTLFFVLPTIATTISNIVFFALTIKYITEATDTIRKMSDNKIDEKKKRTRILTANKKKIFMALKLFLVMGVNWTFETVSSLVDFKQTKFLEIFELILDTFNCLQGFLVFAIFVLKWNTIKSIFGKLKAFGIAGSFSTSSTQSSSAKSSNTPDTA